MAQVPELNLDFWHTIGFPVQAIAEDTTNHVVYYGGLGSFFPTLYPNKPYGVAFDVESGEPLLSLKAPNAPVRASVSDGNGGWYLGGDFTEIGGVPRRHLAQIDADGNLTNWNPAPNGSVSALRIVDGRLFVGGDFSALAGKSRLKAASFDVISGALDGWLPHVSGEKVNDFAADSTKAYIAGLFMQVNLAGINGAAVDATTGAGAGDYAFPDGTVHCSAADGNGGFFIGGLFSNVAGVERKNIAHLDGGGNLTDWNPGADEAVKTLILHEASLYAGGSFSQIAGATRRGAAALDPNTGEALAWNPRIAGEVLSLVIAEEKIFAGGDYSAVGAWSSNGGQVDAVTGDLFFSEQFPDGTVRAAIADGNGGWFIGGEFTKVGFTPRSRIAHINALGELTDWYPGDLNSIVRSFELLGNRLYVSGDFSSIGNEPRNGLAVLDAQSAEVLPWSTFPHGNIDDILVHNDVLYVGGNFTHIGSIPRQRLAALDPFTGEVLPLSISAFGSISALEVMGDTLFFGGNFTSVNGTQRNRIACLSIGSGELLGWNPNANNTVLAMARLNNTLYVGGTFTSIAGLSRIRIAALNITTGTATAWAPNNQFSSTRQLAISGNTVYAGGNFVRSDGTLQILAAALDATSAAVLDWNPGAFNDSFLFTLAIAGDKVYLGGNIASFGGDLRRSASAFDLATGDLLAWNPTLGGNPIEVRAIHAQGQQIYLGGAFASVGGLSRNNLASVDINTAAVNPWNASLNGSGQIRAIAGQGSTLYIGGSFGSVGGQSRQRLAAVDALSGAVAPFNVGVLNGDVYALELHQDALYVAGTFTSIAGMPPGRAVAVDAQSAARLPWNPNVSFGGIISLERAGDKVYMGGFSGSSWGGISATSIAAVDVESGVAVPFNIVPDMGSEVITLLVEDSTLYMGGDFVELNGISRMRLAAINTQDQEILPFNPDFDGRVRTIRSLNNNFWVGGGFSTLNDTDRRSLAVIDKVTGQSSLDTDLFSGSFLGSEINGLDIADGMAYVTGIFLSVGGNSNPYLAKLDVNTGSLIDWEANIDGTGRTIAASGSGVFVGGDFTKAGFRPTEGLVALSTETGAPNGFEVSVNGIIQALKVHNNVLYMGGFFSQIDGQPRTHLAAIDLGTGNLTDWAPFTNSEVLHLEAFGDRIFAAGEFSTANGQPRESIAAFHGVTGALDAFDAAIDGVVLSMLVADGTLYTGGFFSEIQGETRNHLAAFDAGSATLLPFNPDPNDVVVGFAFANQTLYVLGGFNQIGGQAISNVAAINPQTGLALPWSVESEGIGFFIRNIAAWKNQLIVSGNFSQIQGEPRFRLASVSLLDASLSDWDPNPQLFTNNNNVAIANLAAGSDRLYVIGSFDKLNEMVVGSPAVFGALTESCTVNALCQPTTLVLENGTSTLLNPQDVDGGSSTNCGVASLAVSPNIFGPEHLGANVVTLTVTDTQGNSATCETTVTVVEQAAFTLQCPDNVQLSCASSVLPGLTGTAQAESLCGIAALDYADVVSQEACSVSIIRTWTATDLCGNTLTCGQLITQLNDVAPEITMPVQVSVGLTCSALQPDGLLSFLNGDLNTDDAQTYTAFLEQLFATYGLVPSGASTACGEATLMQVGFTAPADISCPVRAVVQAHWLAIDACGNQSDTLSTSIVVSDLSTPVILGTPDVVLDCNSPTTPEFTGFTYASDNCEEDVALTYSDVPLGVGCSSSFIRIWTASDQCGNTATYEQFITLTDLVADCVAPPTGLSAASAGPGAVQLSWNPVPGSIACRVFGRLAGGSASLAAGTVTGNEPGSITVSHPVLQNGVNIEWRVLCACSTQPLVTTPFSAWSNFVFFAPQAIAAQGSATDVPMVTMLNVWPNPSDGMATVVFSPAVSGKARLDLLDLNGRLVDNLYDAHTEFGAAHTVKLDSSHLPNGVYLCRLTTGTDVEVRRLIVAR